MQKVCREKSIHGLRCYTDYIFRMRKNKKLQLINEDIYSEKKRQKETLFPCLVVLSFCGDVFSTVM